MVEESSVSEASIAQSEMVQPEMVEESPEEALVCVMTKDHHPVSEMTRTAASEASVVEPETENVAAGSEDLSPVDDTDAEEDALLLKRIILLIVQSTRLTWFSTFGFARRWLVSSAIADSKYCLIFTRSAVTGIKSS